MVRRTITTEAVGRRELRPELAGVEATASGAGESATTARTVARDRARTIREPVSVVPANAISTTNLRVRGADELLDEVDAEYRATERLRIECRRRPRGKVQ